MSDRSSQDSPKPTTRELIEKTVQTSGKLRPEQTDEVELKEIILDLGHGSQKGFSDFQKTRKDDQQPSVSKKQTEGARLEEKISEDEDKIKGLNLSNLTKNPSMSSKMLEDSKISYQKLRDHIDHNHPTKLDPKLGKQVQFRLCDRLGRLHVFNCCQSCCRREVTEMARQLGVGPSLFLMTVRALATLFLVLTIINLPVLWMISKDSRIEREYPMMKPTLTDLFSRLSLGNLGQQERLCQESSLFPKESFENIVFNSPHPFNASQEKMEQTINLSCPAGKLIELHWFEVLKNPICNTLNQPNYVFHLVQSKVYIDPQLKCTTLFAYVKDQTSDPDSAFQKIKKRCLGQEKCEIRIDEAISVSYDLTGTTGQSNCGEVIQQTFANLPESTQILIAPLGVCKNPTDFDVINMGDMIAGVDLLTILAILLFIWFLQNSSRQFAKQFTNQTLEMNDFAIRVKPMPSQVKYQHNDEILRAHLVAHFEAVVKEQYFVERIKQRREEGEELSREEFETEIKTQLWKNQIQSMPWEVADVSFGKREMGEVLYLDRLTKIMNNFRKTKMKSRLAKGILEKMKISLSLETHKRMFQIEKERFLRMKDSSMNDTQIRYAYVTFRNMRATDLALKAYSVSWIKRVCTLNCLKQCYKISRPGLLRKHFFSSWPSINRACLPEYIKPENLGFTAKERNFRQALTWIVSLAIIILTFTVTITMKNVAKSSRDQMKKFPTSLECFEETPIDDQTSDCKCLIWVSKGMWITVLGNDHCHDYTAAYATLNLISVTTAGLVAIINIASCFIFEKLVSFEKHHTSNEETKSAFFKIGLLQYINISIVLLVVNFGFLNSSAFDHIPLFKGDYHDFSIKWYTEVGKTLGITLFMQMFTPHASKIAQPLIKVYKRYRDRGGASFLKIKDAEDGQDVNTQLLLQDDVNELYTGTQISMQYVLAQIYTYFWCVLTFSTGMPILYLLGFFFFVIFYWVYKGLLLRFYARSHLFSEDLLIESVSLIKYGVLLHLICGSQMVMYLFFELESDEDQERISEVIGPILKRYLNNEIGFFYTIVISLFLFALLFKSTVSLALYRLGKVCTRCCMKKQGVLASKDQEEFSEDIFKDLQLSFLESLYAKACLERDRFSRICNFNITQESIRSRKTEEVEVTSEGYTRFLDRRVIQIEGVIDDHILALDGPDGLDAMNQRNMDAHSKLKHLLQKKDQIPREQRLRLVGVTQSYDVYQSVKFQRVKAVKEILQDDPEYELRS